MSDSDPTGDRALVCVPLLPLRDIIVFPGMVVPLFVGRARSIEALREAMEGRKEVMLCAQKKAKTNEPEPEDLFEIGTLATIRQLIQLPDGTVKVLVLGERRVKLARWLSTHPRFEVEAQALPDEGTSDPEALATLVAQVRQVFHTYVELNRRISPELVSQAAKLDDPSRLSDMIVSQLSLKLGDKQRLLETLDVSARVQQLLELMQEEIEILQVERKIRSRVKKQMEKAGGPPEGAPGPPPVPGGEANEFKNEIDELEARIGAKQVPPQARERLDKELRKLKMMSPMSAEATVVRHYIDWVLGLPWTERSEDRLDLAEAKAILDADHFGLKQAKTRILEFLAVRALVDRARAPILCFVGPPGVGKTSLGRSIAQALGREFVRISLGGVRDEAEIRGHRRTYIGAMPGKLIHAMKRAGTVNPVFLLDEVDKLSSDFRGDPSSALLEVLDPEQNASFNDHYLDLDYDLSDVTFLCTANDLSGIPAPLRDRMEIIRIPGYTDQEKLQIAKRYLVPRQLEATGLGQAQVSFSTGALRQIVQGYTRESGVRNLEREIGGVCRKLAREVVESRAEHGGQGGAEGLVREIKRAKVRKYLGPAPFERQLIDQEDQVGLTHGLAWTQLGGVMLVSEVSAMPGKGKLTITGKLGDVMQESAQAAMSYVRSRAQNLGLATDFHQKVDLHVHFPEGGVPKDGPSAGITMATSIVSSLTGIPVRRDVAMTGEITLRGRVLPIGGLKEKVLAAHRAGIKKVLIPRANLRELKEIPRAVREAVEIVGVGHMDEVLLQALALSDVAAFGERLVRPRAPLAVMFGEETSAEVVPDAVPGEGASSGLSGRDRSHE